MAKKIEYSEALAKRIQNWGEQDARIHNVEMRRWRAKWARRAKLTDALNRIDELASEGANGNFGEQKALEKDYNLVFDAIQKGI